MQRWMQWAARIAMCGMLVNRAWAAPMASNQSLGMPVLSAGYGFSLSYSYGGTNSLRFTLIGAPTKGSLTYYLNDGYTNLVAGIPVNSYWWS